MSETKPSSPSPLPQPVAAAIARARAWMGALSRPARILVLSTVVLAVAFGALVTFKSTHETYGVLFSQLEREDASALVAKLKEMKVPYRIGADGATIEVPEDKVHELRLELAGAGLPRGGGVGFESFDKMRLGATEFEQRVLYRRALEGELSRTIGTLGAVQSARVHLVLPERSVFVARSEPASASVVLRLRPGRALGPSEVNGIVHLTASSVPALTADHVTLVTTDGQMLHKPRATHADGEVADGADDDGDGPSAERAVEASLEDRARAMLEKVVGSGHVDVRVTAEIDRARVERVEDHYDPAKTVLRSEESSVDRTGPNVDSTVAGVPGAESNLPSGAAVPADGGAPPVRSDAVREAHTRNYEIDHVSEKRVAIGATLKRVAVAVILDGVPQTANGKTTMVPRSKEELAKIAILVRSAVGANEARGDVVTVDSIPFLDSEPTAVAEEPTSKPLLPKWRGYVPAGAAAAALLAIGLASAMAARRRTKKAVEAAKIAELSASPAAKQLEMPVEPIDIRAEAVARAKADPATAALVLRFWLGASDAEHEAAAPPPN